MTNRGKDEQGIALMAALLVMMVCSILVAATMAVATHTSQRSGLDRNRSAALHAAEAGIEAELAQLSDGSCPGPADAAEKQLPDQNVPTESYVILATNVAAHPALICTANANAVIAATGYVPSVARPVATMTVVAHVNRGQSAPTSGGASGGYAFSDAIFADGALSASAGLSVFGLGGTVPSITATGPITIGDTLGQLDGPIHGLNSVSVTSAQVGGDVVGTDVTIGGASATVHGNVVAVGRLNLSGTTTVNGSAAYGTTNASTNPTVTIGGNPVTPTNTALAQRRPMPVFTDNQSDISTVLFGAPVAPTGSCPGAGTGNFYDYTAASCTYNPAVVNGTVVVVTHGGTLNVTVPQTAGGQLYIINDSPAGVVAITGTGSTMPVFVYTAGTVTLRNAFSGQVVAGAVTVAAAATMTFVPPAKAMPDMSFPGGFIPPATNLFPSTVAFEYQCPGATTC